jgi:hypothetical protein
MENNRDNFDCVFFYIGETNIDLLNTINKWNGKL